MKARIIRGGIDDMGLYYGDTEDEILDDFATDCEYEDFQEMLRNETIYNNLADYEVIIIDCEE